ncbi:putative ATPase [Synechococcus phage S-PM2]|uniref:Putative ATPase n=1 Tax=Synechococcus phage S-PM2 TaxID=238854 RepID=D8FRN8_BPSYP|nr:putative ATPase [Synechococcus phage S-PM2]CBR26945.1 putative ATPase [Synechococcus phage S-PM2]CFW42449.1 putative ATPase [Synechococcus phage S-PM2]
MSGVRVSYSPWGNPNIAGWNSLVVQRSHKPQVVGSNPTPAPISKFTF